MNNEINLSIKDFQIIKSASMTFVPGLNCIVGQSNNGKTAVFRAAKSCIYNEPGTTSIRHGCSNYAVGIQMNGHKVLLQKGSNTLYKVDDVIYQKIGRTQLPEVASSLNITELNLNGNNEQINFWDQMEKPFLLDRSETDLFRFIVDTGKDSNVTKASKTLISDRQSITKEISVTEGMLQQADSVVLDFENKLIGSDLKLEVCSKVISLNSRLAMYNSLKSKISEYIDISSSLAMLKDSYGKLSSTLDLLVSQLYTIETYISKKISIESAIDSYNVAYSNLEILKSTAITKDISDDRLVEYYNKFNELKKYILDYDTINSKLASYSTYSIPDISYFISRVDLYNSIDKLLSESEQLSSSIKSYSDDILSIDDEINQLTLELDSIGICPTCGQPINHNI